jgi:RNA polymerase sigma factor (sigma-70 family)
MAAQSRRLLHHLWQLVPRPPSDPATDAGLLERFVRHKDEDAFAALIGRHGPMVIGVCRRILGGPHEAEDVAQATFLVLARKAGTIRRPATLAAWLHRTAHNLALKWRRDETRRREREIQSFQAAVRRTPDPLEELTVRELLAIFDEELQRLPERFRLPLILCCLEGLTQEEAARQLGWTPGALKGRLERGRVKLHRRLAARGLTLPAVLVAVATMQRSGEAAGMPTGFVSATGRAAVVFATKAEMTEGPIAANVLALAEAGARRTVQTRGKIVLALLLAVGVGSAGIGALAHPEPAAQLPEQSSVAELESGYHDAQPPGPAKQQGVRTDLLGDPLPPGALVRMGAVRWRLVHTATGIVFSRDGKMVAASGGQDGFIHLWETSSGRELHRLDGGGFNVTGLDLSPDGKILAATVVSFYPEERRRVRGRVQLWDFATRKRTRDMEKPDWQPTVVTFAPDGKTLAVGAQDGSIYIGDAFTGAERLSFKAHSGQVFSLVFSPDSRALASTDGDEAVRLLDPATGKELCKLQEQSNRFSFCSRLAFSRDGTLLAAVEHQAQREPRSDQNTVVLWEVATGKVRRRLVGKRYAGPWHVNLLDVAFSQDDRTIASTQNDGRLMLWDAATDKPHLAIPALPHGAWHITFSPDSKTLVGCCFDEAIRLWDVATGKEIGPGAESHHSAVTQLLFSLDGRTLITSCDDASIRLWDAATGRQRLELKGHDFWVRAVALSPDGETLASSSLDDSVRLWDVGTGKLLHRLPGHGGGGGSRALAFAPDGKALASWGDDWELRVWEADTGKLLLKCPPRLTGVTPLPGRDDERMRDRELELRAFAYRFGFTPDGKRLVIVSRKTIHVVDAATGNEQLTIPGGVSPDPFAFSPDGRLVVVHSGQHLGRVVELASGKEMVTLDGFDPTQPVAFSPDGQSVAASLEVGMNNGLVRFWELRTGQEILDVRCPNPVRSLAFSPEGKTLATGLGDTTVLVWDLSSPLAALGRPAGELRRRELEQLWDDLAGADARKAYAACRTLAGVHGQAVALVKERLQPIGEVDAKRIGQLITDLESDRFEARQKASQELERLGPQAEPMLRRVLKQSPSAELRRRVQALLAVPPAVIRSSEVLRQARAIQVLEWIGSTDARQVLQHLAQGAASARQTQEARAALDRLRMRRASNP